MRPRRRPSGLDLQGGTELIFQARPTPQNPTIDGSDIDRAIEIIRKRTDAFGVSEPEISRVGSDSIRVGLPNVSNAATASEQVGQTAQLYFYDWEPNVIPQLGEDATFPAASPLRPPLRRRAARFPAAARSASRTSAPRAGRTYYLFNSQTHNGSPGRPIRKKDLFSELPGQKQPPNSVILTVPQGTVVVRRRDSTAIPRRTTRTSPTAEWFVIRDRPALSGTDITDPKPNFDQFNQPIVTFNFTDTGR